MMVELLAEALLFWSWGPWPTLPQLTQNLFWGQGGRENLPILIMLAQIPVFSAIGQ